MSADRPVLLTVSEVSKILRIHRAKVYILIDDGTLTATKVGCDWRVRTESVERLTGSLPSNVFAHNAMGMENEAAAAV